jgi:hypothetical protein
MLISRAAVGLDALGKLVSEGIGGSEVGVVDVEESMFQPSFL